MILNPNLIYYACIARGSVILGENLPKEQELAENCGQQCIDNTPPHHSMFSHRVCRRTYMFLIDDPFTYFGIFDECLEKSESRWFLNRVKSAFEESGLISDAAVAPGCFQTKFDLVLGEMMLLDLEFLNLMRTGALSMKHGRNSSVGSMKGGRMVVAPLLGEQANGLKKKKNRTVGNGQAANGDVREMNVDKLVVCDDVVAIQKNAKQIWKKYVWIVLGLVLFVCAVLFGIWLWVCRGFQCVGG